jgi:ParB family chromosome partitioning protein
MKITKDDLFVAAREMIDVMELVNNQTDKIPIQLEDTKTEDELKSFILTAAKDRYDSDKFTELTEDIIKELADNPAPTGDTLADDIAQADTLKELRNIAKAEDAFKSIRGNLMSYKEVEFLKNDMLEILSDTPNTDKIVEEKIVVNALPEAQGASKTKSDTLISKMMKVSEIITKEPFSGLFKIDPLTREKIKSDMEENGFDRAFPVILWGNVLIDGNTRLLVARELEIEEVPVEVKEFFDQQEALEYAIHAQRDRRNITDSEILSCIEVLDEKMSRKEAGAKGGNKEKKEEPSHVKTAKTLKVTKTKVSDARAVLTDAVATEEVKSGKKTISKAAKEVREKKKPVKEVKEIKKTRLEAVAEVAKGFMSASTTMQELIEESDILFEDWGGKTDMKEMEKVVMNTLDVLKAFGLVVFLGEDEISVKGVLII